jgi:nicotinate-nucleotide pyrophosphorylase (carboxylating)
MWSEQTIQLIHAAYDEDLGQTGDITSRLLGESDAQVTGHVVPREDGIICGLALAFRVCDVFAERLGRELAFAPATVSGETFEDGRAVTAGTRAATVNGSRAAVLAVERTLLNFLGRMSGVATLTRRFVDAAQATNPKVQVLDTRKTIPGWRELDKYSVRCGGGHNHRAGLYDAILIKDNHLASVTTEELAGRLFHLLNRKTGAPKFVEVEVDDLKQLEQVCKVVGVDVVLLDNFTPEQMRAAVAYRDELRLRGKIALEASGGITLANVAEIAATGVDRISVGALTHSAASLNIALDL